MFLAIAALVASCVTPPVRVSPGQETITPSLVWPQPPLQPRIRFVRSVAHPQDLAIQASFWKRLGEIIVGREEEWLIRPTGVASRGHMIYVADPGAQTMWILDAQAGRFRRIQQADGQRLISPVALAVEASGRIYLADSYLAKVFVYDAGERLTGAIASPDLRRPSGLAYDGARDRLYVADSAAHRIWIFDGKGNPIGRIGQRGAGSGEFNFPTHVAVDREGSLFVTDSLGFRVQFFSPNGAFAGQFGKHGDNSGEFAMPKGVAVDSKDHVYVVDALFDAVQIFDRRGQFLLSFGERGIGPGQFWLPGGLFIDPQDRIYVADAYNQRIQIFEYIGG
jgi:DNA-binding beta-propeller fold protein YncE